MTQGEPTDALRSLLRQLWDGPMEPWLRALLPADLESLSGFYPRLQKHFDEAPRHVAGTIDPAALVAGDIISIGEGSVIEAGAIIHHSCRLIMGKRSTIRPGAVLRDEVIVGDDCMVGAHCEVMRSVIAGPDTALGHHVVLGDSIVGSGSLMSGFVAVANTHIHRGEEIALRTAAGTVMTGRSYLGVMIGDRVRIGGTTTICPGTVILPGLDLPPGAVLLGVIDARRCSELTRDFFGRWGDGLRDGTS